MSSITGFGGTFIRATDPEALYQWYEQHLGLTPTQIAKIPDNGNNIFASK